MYTDPDCIFCKIAAGTIPSKKVFEDDELFAFHDINPGAPTHVLIIPKNHIVNTNDITEENAPMIGRLILKAAQLAQELGVAESGYRIVTNAGIDAGQSVWHLHIHMLGGRKLTWPPG